MFRKLNPKIMERYLPFFNEQVKHRREVVSDYGWVNGMYFGRALGSCFSKGSKYPNEPLILWNDGDSEKNHEPFTDADRFAEFVAEFNKNNFG